MSLKMFFVRIAQFIKNIFLHGFFTLLPLVLTTGIFIFFYRLIMSWVTPLHSYMPPILQQYPYSEFAVGLLLIFALGFILKYVLFLPLFHFFESILSKIPLIRPVYFGIKQLIHAFTSHDENAFNKVVLIEYPRKGLYTIGFLTGKQHPHFELDPDTQYFHVYVPSVPNPTTGVFIIVPEHDMKITNLTRQEALAIVISGGVISPRKNSLK